MENKKPFPTENHKDHFLYNNEPFFNREHGDLGKIEWATIIDISLIKRNDYNNDDDIIPPHFYLQISPTGEIRGVTHEYDEHEEYFSVTADEPDAVFLKLFTEQFPNHIPTLTSLLHYRKVRLAALRASMPNLEDFSDDDDFF